MAPPPSSWPYPDSLDVNARDGAGDDEPLDLRGALEDGPDLGVAVHPLHGELPRVAVPAEDLHGTLGRPDGDLAGLQLRHRALGGLEVLAVLAHPGRPMDQQPRRVDLHLHVGEGEGDRLVLDDLAPEGLALLRVVEREFIGRSGDADGLGRDGRARELEGPHGRLSLGALAFAGLGEALVELLLAAEQAGAGDAAVVEMDVRGVRGT